MGVVRIVLNVLKKKGHEVECGGWIQEELWEKENMTKNIIQNSQRTKKQTKQTKKPPNNNHQASKEKEFSWRQGSWPHVQDILILTLISLMLFIYCVVSQGRKYCFQARALTLSHLLSLIPSFPLCDLRAMAV